MMISGRNKFPFTATQWQELEHQALVYKYMTSGIPIPPDLLFTIKRSCLDSALSAQLFSGQPPVGWSCFQMGLGRKADPEPGRCRRTDGKKWRCSKEAYPDSKYCERHMHRGKNRSRKPVEVAATQTTTKTTPFLSSITKNQPPLETQRKDFLHYPSSYSNPMKHPFHSPYGSSRPPGSGTSAGASPRGNSTHLLLDTGESWSLANTDYRNAYGRKEELDEHPFFTEPSGSVKASSFDDDAWQLTPLTMSSCSSSSYSPSMQRSSMNLHNEYSHLQLQSVSGDHDLARQQKQYQGINFLSNGREETQKTFHRFFDEWPPKNKDSWLDLDTRSSNSASVSTTNLSISIPSSHDSTIFNSRIHDGN